MVTGAALTVNPPTTVAAAPNTSVTVTVYKLGVRAGTLNCVMRLPSEAVGPKRLSSTVLFTVVLSNLSVTLADESK